MVHIQMKLSTKYREIDQVSENFKGIVDGSYLIAEYSTVVGAAPEKGVSELKKARKTQYYIFIIT